MARIWLIFSALCLLAVQPAAAQTPPAPEALVDRFMAAIPDSRARSEAREREETLNVLRSANPGAAEASIQAVANAALACFAPLRTNQTERTLRQAVRQLGAEKLTRLIAFYEGPDHPLLRGISEARSRGTMTDAQNAERQRIFAAYPLADFATSSQATLEALSAEPAYLRELARCREIATEARDRHGLRSP